MTPSIALERGLQQLALAIPPSASEQMLRYVSLLAKWNRTYNLTAIRDPLGMVHQHLLDSLAVLPHLPLPIEGTLDIPVLSEEEMEAGSYNYSAHS